MVVKLQNFPSRLLVNSASIFSGEAIARLSTFLMSLVIARRFGAIALGSFGYAVALSSIIQLVPDMGLQLFAVREISANPRRLRAIFWNVHWLKLILAGLVVVFSLCFGQWEIDGDSRRLLFYLFAARVLLQTFSQVSMAVFKAFERMQSVALQQTANTVVTILWLGVALLFHAELPLVAFALVVGQAAEMSIGWYLVCSKFPPGRPEPWNAATLWSIAAACLPIGITAILQAINLRIDVLVLGRYVSTSVFGQFQAAAWFAVATFLVTSLLMTVLFPRLSRLLREDSGRGSSYLLSLLKNGLLVTTLVSLTLWLLAPIIVPLVFGGDLAPAAEILRVFIPVLPLIFMNTVLFYVFVAAGRRFVCIGTFGVGIIAGTVLCAFLSRRYGAAGCAVSDLVREFIIGAAYLCFLVQGSHAREAGLALLKVFLMATVLLGIGTLTATSLRHAAEWLAVWTASVLAGTVVLLGVPRLKEWRLLTDDVA